MTTGSSGEVLTAAYNGVSVQTSPADANGAEDIDEYWH